MLVRTVRSAQPYSRRVLATNLILEMDNTRVNKVVQLCVGHSQKRLSKQLKVQHSSSRKGKQRLQVTSDAQGGRARPHFCTSVEDLPARYRGILLDQFGVLHNGKEAYPDAIAAVAKLAKSGRKVVILSNSSRRSSSTLPKLAKMGFPADCFSGAVTSGDITFHNLSLRPDGWWQSLGRRCLHITWGERGPVSVKGLNLEVVTEPEDAEFVLAHGTEALGRGDGHQPVAASLEEIKGLLRRAADRGLPLIVANPDVVTVSGAGLVPMPGTFARWYKEWRGEIRLMGKPHPIIYKFAEKVMGLSADQVLAVGDSLEHDICGAQAAGIDSLFVAGGIHAAELAVLPSQLRPDADQLDKLCLEHNAHPEYLIPYLT